MIEVRYSRNSGVEISGTYIELLRLKQEIEEFLKSDVETLTIEASIDCQPHPCDITIPKIVIEKGQGPTKVSVINNQEVHIRGDLDNLEMFAIYFEFSAESTSGDHGHFEYYEDNEWIDRESEPVVIGVK